MANILEAKSDARTYEKYEMLAASICIVATQLNVVLFKMFVVYAICVCCNTHKVLADRVLFIKHIVYLCASSKYTNARETKVK